LRLKSYKIYLIAIIVIVFPNLATKGQDQLEGLLLNKENNKPIVGSHVMNISNKTLAISNEEGSFKISGQPFDTLIISNINYKRKALIINDLKSFVIYLYPLIIQLEEVEVSNVPSGVNIFSERIEFIEKKRAQGKKLFGVKPAKPKAAIPPLFQKDNSLKFWEQGRILPPPFYDIYLIPKLLNRKYKTEMKYYDLTANEKQIIENNEKFNQSLVKNLVGLEGDLLTDFISFMNVDEELVEASSEYEITEFIKNKYDEFMNFGY